MTSIATRIAIVYGIGFASLVFGFYEFWSEGTVNQHAFLIGGTAVGAAAAVQVIQDLWHRMRR